MAKQIVINYTTSRSPDRKTIQFLQTAIMSGIDVDDAAQNFINDASVDWYEMWDDVSGVFAGSDLSPVPPIPVTESSPAVSPTGFVILRPKGSRQNTFYLAYPTQEYDTFVEAILDAEGKDYDYVRVYYTNIEDNVVDDVRGDQFV